MRDVNLRIPKPFGQRSNSELQLNPKKKYFLVVEGSKTEIDYFNGIFNFRKELDIDDLIDIIVVEREVENATDSHPLHLLNGILKRTGKVEIEDSYTTLEYDEEIDEIWLIFDRDPGNFSHEQFDHIHRICNENNFKIGLTNPNFEFWLLLHCEGINKYDNVDLLANRKVSGKRRYIEKLLSDILNGYSKNNIKFERFKDTINLAIEQEKSFEQRIPEIFNSLGSNIGVLLSKMKQD